MVGYVHAPQYYAIRTLPIFSNKFRTLILLESSDETKCNNPSQLLPFQRGRSRSLYNLYWMTQTDHLCSYNQLFALFHYVIKFLNTLKL